MEQIRWIQKQDAYSKHELGWQLLFNLSEGLEVMWYQSIPTKIKRNQSLVIVQEVLFLKFRGKKKISPRRACFNLMVSLPTNVLFGFTIWHSPLNEVIGGMKCTRRLHAWLSQVRGLITTGMINIEHWASLRNTTIGTECYGRAEWELWRRTVDGRSGHHVTCSFSACSRTSDGRWEEAVWWERIVIPQLGNLNKRTLQNHTINLKVTWTLHKRRRFLTSPFPYTACYYT